MKILLAEKSSFSEAGIAALEELGDLDARDLNQNDLLARIPGYDVLVVRLGLRVEAAVLRAGTRLKVIVTPTTGLDHIDLTVAIQNGVEVISLKGERQFLDQVPSTAEHTFALMLALLRKIPSAFEAVKDYHWRRDVFRGYELEGKVVGLIGCGRLGTIMARYCQAFGMRVLVYDPYQTNLPPGIEVVASLGELLGRSEIVSLHLHLNDETKGLLSKAEFDQMRPGAVLVNTSRGSIVDEMALIQALERGHLAGAAVDVLCDEHSIEKKRSHAMIDYASGHENLIITPHIGGATFEAVEKADLFVIRKLGQRL